jgi:hypothetical protein
LAFAESGIGWGRNASAMESAVERTEAEATEPRRDDGQHHTSLAGRNTEVCR